MGIGHRSLRAAWVYRLWQAPFADRKLDPIVRRGLHRQALRVLDVGCGPGTNTHYFEHADYLGIDTNPDYITSARRRHGRRFEVVDVTDWTPEDGGYDFVFLNSLMHHLPDDAVRRLLAALAPLVAPGGAVHVLDLVLPPRRDLARVLARLDRGDHPRALEHWERLFSEHFEPRIFEPYPLGVGPLCLWNMVYFQGTPRTA
jgi:trans-aconitate methyltransferase